MEAEVLIDAALAPEELKLFRQLTTCQVADAIETKNLRLRNEGFMDASVHCMFPSLPPVAGYAVTAQVRTASPPMTGKTYPDRADWWKYLLSVPAPRMVVLEDLDSPPGLGSCAGKVHGHIYKALGCVGLITNGAVRHLDAVESIGLSFFAGRVAISSAYYHMAGFGMPVEVGSLKIKPGDLLHADRHGVISVPPAIARDVPAIAARIAELEGRVIQVTNSRQPSIEELSAAVRQSVEEGRFRR